VAGVFELLRAIVTNWGRLVASTDFLSFWVWMEVVFRKIIKHRSDFAAGKVTTL
jgi:hypothetical protein